MWTFAASIPDGYLIALIPIVGAIACGIGAWVFRGMSNGDRRLTVLEGHDQEHIKDIADHENRLRDLERR